MNNYNARLSFMMILFVMTCLAVPKASRGAVVQSIVTDADAGVRMICRNDLPFEECITPRGSDHPNIDGWENHPRYVVVKDQNNLDVGYWHFDLTNLAPDAQVTEARFQLDAQTNSWGDTTVSVFAIADPDRDWDLDAVPESEIVGPNAPQSDYESFAWEGVDGPPQRFNAPLPFLDEGRERFDAVRELDSFLLIENQDPNTQGSPETPGNSYGGYPCCDASEGEEGSAWLSEDGDNIWPIKNAIDIDITELVRWKQGNHSDYSDFSPTDSELTMLVRTDFPIGGENGFVAFISRESEFIGGPLDLAPGRIVITTADQPGDFDANGALDLHDIDLLIASIAQPQPDLSFDLDANNLVDGQDLMIWVQELKLTWVGDSNLDGEFNSSDLVAVLDAGKFEQDEFASWAQGDWDGDQRFNTSDLIAALNDGGYELGLRTAAIADVPEPSLVWHCLACVVGLAACRRTWSTVRPRGHSVRFERVTRNPYSS